MNISEKVKHIIAKELALENVSESDTLEKLELDSLEFVFLMTAIGKEIAEIPEAKWAQMHTVLDIVRALDQKAA